MSQMQDDELTLLWRQGTSAKHDNEEIARLAGRASMRRFDRLIFWRNFGEYAAGLVVLVLSACGVVAGHDPALDPAVDLVTAGCIAFALGSLWWQHRDLAPLDPSADARAYQAAMLARLDKQIRLLGSVRYWYLIPLYLPGLWMVIAILRTHDTSGLLGKYRPVGAVVYLAIQTVVFVGIAKLSERSRWGIPRLRAERAKIEKLYKD